MAKTTVIIADDHPLFRAGVRVELESAATLDIVAETGSGLEAYDMIIARGPDVAVLDIQMPGLTGIEITEKLRAAGNQVKIVLLTMYNEKKIFLKALRAGVNGYVLKDDAVLDIVNAVNSVIAGGTFISSTLAGLLADDHRDQADPVPPLLKSLSPAEKKILLLISELRSNEEIAEQLFISKRTVENHKVLIAKKLLLDSSRDLLKLAVRWAEYLKQE